MKRPLHPTGRVFAAVLLVLAGGVPVPAARLTPLKIEQTVEARFPNQLTFSALTHGAASVVIDVDDQGRLVDTLVTSYTDKAFADEAVDALKHWRYEPAREDGRPVGLRTELRFEFVARGRVISLTAIETMAEFVHKLDGERLTTAVCSAQELDRPVQTVQAVAPLPLRDTVSNRTVKVDFYVDETGTPRMPVVLDSPSNAYAQAALEALTQWRFARPTRNGRPVAVRVRQEFVFTANS